MPRIRAWRAPLLGLLFSLLIHPLAPALEAPEGKVVLILSGKVGSPNRSDKSAAFSMAMLARLPQHSYTVQTPWYPRPMTFTGPLMRDVLAAAGAQGEKIIAVALNDYRTELPFSDATQLEPILARLLNGKPMAVRDKGPLFIIYPSHLHAELSSQLYFNRSAWQLSQLLVE
ncbi:hypothetical protein HNP55_001782 [Paucibacter oligotrophus]|uniref:Oxidoreductase molybdopterin-binding domain-containing protein n=1 Tax=Roseateles oligotrophus TaxID=1769250 RepID=A0A840L929_9BURK|nr:molybdopterin-dependent oxidoreductase [Roseateles oligotrophus]MBB4843263.1 hypothetical protein [Roseateles oligotrophus]